MKPPTPRSLLTLLHLYDVPLWQVTIMIHWYWYTVLFDCVSKLTFKQRSIDRNFNRGKTSLCDRLGLCYKAQHTYDSLNTCWASKTTLYSLYYHLVCRSYIVPAGFVLCHVDVWTVAFRCLFLYVNLPNWVLKVALCHIVHTFLRVVLLCLYLPLLYWLSLYVTLYL